MRESGEDRLGVLRGLVAGAVRPPEDGPPEGASPAQLPVLASRLGQPLPAALAAWLPVCNGAMTGPGGVVGQRPDRRILDIMSAWEREPGWRERGWIPSPETAAGTTTS